jgi:hypothetical protein
MYPAHRATVRERCSTLPINRAPTPASLRTGPLQGVPSRLSGGENDRPVKNLTAVRGSVSYSGHYETPGPPSFHIREERVMSTNHR